MESFSECYTAVCVSKAKIYTGLVETCCSTNANQKNLSLRIFTILGLFPFQDSEFKERKRGETQREREPLSPPIADILIYKNVLSNNGPLFGWYEAPFDISNLIVFLVQIPVNLLLAFTHFHLKSLFGLNRLQ